MRIKLKRKILPVWLLIFLPIFSFNSCKDSKSVIKKNKIFISEFLENRKDSLDVHDRKCLGYYQEHFNQEFLNGAIPTKNELKLLEQKTSLKWSKISNDSLYDFNEYFSKKNNIFPSKDYENKVIYLLEIIESNENEVRYLSTGSDDGFVLWVNGIRTTMVHKGRHCQANSEFSEIKLQKGQNTLLYKIENGLGGWGLFKKFIEKDKIKNILLEKKLDHITDKLEACIIPDSATSILIKESTINVSINTFLFDFSWIDSSSNVIGKTKSFTINNLPRIVVLPDDYNGIGRLRTTVRNEKNEIIYVETNPIFYESRAKELAKLITTSQKTNNPIFEARRDAVLDLFDIVKTTEDKKTYSTRTKANGLWDLYEAYKDMPTQVRLDNGPSIMGYKSEIDNTNQMYRVFIPESVGEKKSEKLPILFSIDYNRHDYPSFLQGVGRSHFYMSYWQAMATNFNNIIVTPYGRGRDIFPKDEINAINNQIHKNINFNSKGINLLGASTAAQKTIEIIENLDLEVSHVGLMGSTINLKGEVLLQKFKSIYNKHPKIKFFIVHGIEDKDYSIKNIREIVKAIKSLGFYVKYFEIPDATHELDFTKWYKEFLTFMNNPKVD